MDRTHHLRVLIANQRADRLELLARVVSDLGHEIIAREIEVEDVGAVTARERPDLALVGLGESSDHALELITEIVRGSFCPVIALLEGYDADWIDQAAQRGVYAYIVDTRPEELQSAINITLRRFAEFQNVQGAFERRSADAHRETRADARTPAKHARDTRRSCPGAHRRPPRSRARPARGIARSAPRGSRERPCNCQPLTGRPAERGCTARATDRGTLR